MARNKNRTSQNLTYIRNIGSLIPLLFCLSHTPVSAQILEKEPELDVLSYRLSFLPDFDTKSIEGIVYINFLRSSKSQPIVFSCGELDIKEVAGASMESYYQKDKKLFVNLSESEETIYTLKISYAGSPKRGLIFLSEPSELYTVYSTSEWMPCHDSPDDKATISMDLSVPKGFTALASGELISAIDEENDLVRYSFTQTYGSPAYTYGLVIGKFKTFREFHGETTLQYYSSKHSPEQLARIFGKTGDMLSFFEKKTGLIYDQHTYSQILIGNHYQEMSNLSVLKKGYGRLVLADSTETNLISHELAHQWWGNRITCESWSHFWLNEGFATFLSAAYNEHRFGKEKYLSDINSYKQVYLGIKKRGKDKSLVFKDWINPSGEDRNLVYFKGAYVLHLLREEMGENAFWAGIKFYSQSYFGKSVNTQNFQKAMEASSSLTLQAFFDKWMY